VEAMMKIDIFNHIFPKKYFDRMCDIAPKGKDMLKRVREIPALVDVDERFRIMDKFIDYVQVLCLPVPPIETFCPPAVYTEMVRLANEGMAELVSKFPERFPGFVASLPMNDPEGLIAEARRAIVELGAVGVQVHTNVLGRALDRPEMLRLFDLMVELDRPVWIHPTRGADFPDYQSESRSYYEIWQTLGYTYETSVAMARLVFSGLFDRHPEIKIITHHMGAMIPYVEGRVASGWDQIGSRTSDEDYTLLLKRLKKRPVDYFHMFYGDTALLGAREATVCGLKFFGVDKTLFGTDAPFDPEKGSAFIRWTIEIIDSLNITDDERKEIYEGNARRLLRLK
jgi:predicted TIM-barrel fold metal-dependent hydrolase